MLSRFKYYCARIKQKPELFRELLRPRRWRQFLSIVYRDARSGSRWSSAADQEALKQREYQSYSDYMGHQASKLKFIDLAKYDVEYRALLRERLTANPLLKRGMSVLCLAARIGTEVKSFQDLGCFAVGIDLNPGEGNPYVLKGDFHAVQFPDASVEVIFTNSLDHAFDPRKLLGEVRRLLKPGGIFIVEAIRGSAEAIEPDDYASFWWNTIDDLAGFLAANGLVVVQRKAFETPWPGEQLCFKVGV